MTEREEKKATASHENVELEEGFMWVKIEGRASNLKYDIKAGANGIFNKFMKFQSKGILQLTVQLYKSRWNNE